MLPWILFRSWLVFYARSPCPIRFVDYALSWSSLSVLSGSPGSPGSRCGSRLKRSDFIPINILWTKELQPLIVQFCATTTFYTHVHIKCVSKYFQCKITVYVSKFVTVVFKMSDYPKKVVQMTPISLFFNLVYVC